MTEFKRIIQLRNNGKTQREIGIELGLSERTVRNYLKTGSIPSYTRTVSTRPDPLSEVHLQIAHEMLQGACDTIQLCDYNAVHFSTASHGHEPF